MRSIQDLTKFLRYRGLKVTPQRLIIFQVMDGNTAHPTAEDVYQQVIETMPTISLTTVYKTLNELVEMGELQQIDLGDGTSRFDPNTEPHGHLVCTVCKNVVDMPSEAFKVNIADAQGFNVSRIHLMCYGTCEDCARICSDCVRKIAGHTGKLPAHS